MSVCAHEAIADANRQIWVSAVSGWEIATKYRLGKMGDIDDPKQRMPDLIEQHGFGSLPVTIEHALEGGLLPGAHRDPFDRLIAAQALVEKMTVVTCDPALAALGCEVLW